MKTFLLIALMAAFATFATKTNATIRRVGYFGTATAIDYTTLQAAHDAAKAGDTIYLYPGTSWYATFSKKIILIGYGYFLTGTGSNPGLQNVTGALSVNVTLNTGADNSVFESLDGLYLTIYYQNPVNNVSVGRCHVQYLYLNDQVNTGWQIAQSFISYFSSEWAGGTFSNFSLTNSVVGYFDVSQQAASSGSLKNDFFDYLVAYSGPNFGNGNLQVTNCIFDGSINGGANCVFHNCIGSSGITSANGGYTYPATPLPTGNGIHLVDVSTVYVGYVNNTGNYSTDGAYALSANSPAKGAGANGVDCGIFGGANPYVLSGLPAVPAITSLTAPGNITAGNPYTILLNVQSY